MAKPATASPGTVPVVYQPQPVTTSRRSSGRTSSRAKEEIQSAKDKLKRAAAKARALAEEAPVEIMAGGAGGAVLAGYVDRKFKPMLGKIPNSTALGVAAGAAAVAMRRKKGSKALAGAAVAMISPYLYGVGENLAGPSNTNQSKP